MTREPLFSSRVGDRWSLAVEFEALGDLPRTWNEWWGSLWLWANGHIVGRPFEVEMLISGFDPLIESLYQMERNTESRTSVLLASLPPNQALDLVMWAQYGEDDPPEGFNGDRALLKIHEVLPRGSPFFDGWEALLITEGPQERFIFRHKEGEASQTQWPKGTFRSIVVQAQEEFQKLARAHMAPPSLA